jgi:23S rRNA pseudouridine1911/1915/1917 synthase
VAPEPKGENIALDIVYEDDDIIVIDKPKGLVVHPAAGHESGTLVNALIAHCGASLSGIGGVRRPGIVHRLDKDTSGCLVVAKTEPALRALQAQFKARTVEKRYRALVHGAPPDRGELDTLIARHPVDRKRFSTKVREGKRAVTRFTTLGRASFARNADAAWVDVELLTGRTHQIRAHFADAGWPLFCDALYGGTRREGPAAPEPVRRAASALGRQGLHAFRLAFTHPETGMPVRCEAPIPPDLRAALDELGIAPAGGAAGAEEKK